MGNEIRASVRRIFGAACRRRRTGALLPEPRRPAPRIPSIVVISHRHRYLFVQLPQTACTAVQNELIEHYGGEKILFKHALYSDFLAQATGDEKTYFTFSSLRNPLDIAVSKFFKYRTDHVGAYSEQRLKKFGRLHKYVLWYTDRRRYRFITERDASFEDFFRRFYKLPYASWAILDHHRFDYLIRYENLQEDFREVIHRIGVEPVRDLPAGNVTGQKSRDFWSYYDSPELRARARRLFSRYMEEWGYEWPGEFLTYPAGSKAAYRAVSALRRLYWRLLR